MFAKRQKKQTVTLDDGTEAAKIPLPTVPAKRTHAQTPASEQPAEPVDNIGLSSYGDGNATYASESLTEEDGRAKAIKTLSLSRKIKSGEEQTGLYRGESNYPVYAEKSEKDIYAAKFTGSLGPIKAPQHYRASCRFDYAMGICKDWKEAGYCGFGDTCIFVHDRSDYKSGYQMEKDWEDRQNRERKRAFGEAVQTEPDYEIHSDEDESHLCGICSGEYTDPVITECGHIFCYKCALAHYEKSKKCAECRADTKGIFNNWKV